jgi:hypothetical protein
MRLSRKLATTVAVAGAIALPSAAAAQAYQLATVTGSKTFKTWFFGPTEFCVTNVGTGDGPFYWTSGPTGRPGELKPGQATCINSDFWGYNLNFDSEAGTPLTVQFPDGP